MLPLASTHSTSFSSMADLDPSLLLRGHALLSALSAFSSSPLWNVPVSLYGLAVIHQDGAQAGEALRTFIAVLGGSFVLDFVWFVTNSTHGLARVLILFNFLLKPVTIMSTLSQLRARGDHGPSFQGFSVPSGIADRIPGSFPPFGHRQPQQNETVFQQPSSYQQPRFSLDEDLEAGGAGSGASTPSVRTTTTGGATDPLFSPSAPASSAGGGGKKKAAKSGAAPAQEERPAPPYRAGSTTAAEGGGYHSLE
ncbi:hypothetical protein JCM6882_003195 [Rhodosporidiobolus microsporus]